MESTEQAGWENRLEELIENHVRSLKNDFRSFLDEMVAPEPPDPEPPADLQATLVRLKESVDAVLGSGSQQEMANHLLDAVSLQANRAALLLVREKGLCTFDARGFDESAGNMAAFQAEPAGDDPLARALLVTQHLPGEALHGTCLAAWHDNAWPAQVCLAPIYVGSRTVAVVYADSGDTGTAGRIHPEAVEILASMAGLFLDRLRHASRLNPATTPDSTSLETENRATDRLPAGAPLDDTDAAQPTASPVSFEEVTQHEWTTATNAGAGPAGPFSGGAPDESPEVNPEAADTELTDNDMATDTPPAPDEEFDPAATIHDPVSVDPPPVVDTTATLPSHADAVDEPLPEPPPLETVSVDPETTAPDAFLPENDRPPEAIPVATLDSPSAPAGTSADGAMVSTASGGSLRAATTDETILPAAIPVSPEPSSTSAAASPSPAADPLSDDDVNVASDLPVNPDAERFARLLVSEIVLYNEAMVTTGRRSRDLYRRLQDPIDRSREVFVDRFSQDLLVLFEAELVRTLADNDRELMGSAYA